MKYPVTSALLAAVFSMLPMVVCAERSMNAVMHSNLELTRIQQSHDLKSRVSRAELSGILLSITKVDETISLLVNESRADSRSKEAGKVNLRRLESAIQTLANQVNAEPFRASVPTAASGCLEILSSIRRASLTDTRKALIRHQLELRTFQKQLVRLAEVR